MRISASIISEDKNSSIVDKYKWGVPFGIPHFVIFASMIFADVILPVAVARTYTYLVPENMESDIAIGSRVIVELGFRKYTGIVMHLSNECDISIKYKPIVKLLDSKPLVSEYQLLLWDFISKYYCCQIGDVLKMALPVSWAKDDYTPSLETYIHRTDKPLVLTGRSKVTSKQQSVLDFLSEDTILKQELLKIGSPSIISKLIENGYIVEEKRVISRLKRVDATSLIDNLSNAQQKAYESIKQGFASNKNVLLHGITSSGKTQIYMKLIQETIESGGQVLYLVPEITLTEHLACRLQQKFGSSMLVYHSKISDSERAEIYRDVRIDDSIKLIVGVRSSIFLPYRNLKLIIIDEEHDASYKQWEPAPRYNARNAALYLAKLLGINVLMGSATPSIESYYNALNGKYHLVELNQRYDGAELPKITVINRYKELKKGKMQGVFSWDLRDAIKDRLDRDEQVILFQNRRGYNTFSKCLRCGWTPKCPQCDVGLIYHQVRRKLTCHYCSHTQEMPTNCPQCGDIISSSGIGTERVEEELKTLFPNVAISRLDVDNVKTQNEYRKILDDFSARKSQVLIGTQIVVKGLDFENVTLVGIINGDNMLDYPEFRATERAFQMFVQVAGRAGRRQNRGEVILQTSQPEHPIIESVRLHDYRMFYNMQIEERSLFRYPPFYRIVAIYVKHKDASTVDVIANELENLLAEKFGSARIMGPFVPPLSRHRLMYIRQITMKLESNLSYIEVSARIQDSVAVVRRKYSTSQIIIDVDPA